MSKPSHIIISRMNFIDEDLLDRYLVITREILIPSFINQTNQNFVWGVTIKPQHVDKVSEYLNYPFIRINSAGYKDFVIKNNFVIQTRHDIDDWMSDNYVQKIQELYEENISNMDSFLIQSQPLKMDYKTGVVSSLSKYTNKRTSMHLSLCQKEVINHINERKHGQMWEITPNVITLPEGYTKWVRWK